MSELETRFDEASCHYITEFLLLLPSANADEASSLYLDGLLSFYDNDLPHPLSLSCELDMWKHTWGREKDLASKLKKPYHMLIKIFPPNIRVLLSIMATLPVTSCECECSISMLKLIKIPLRSTTL